MHIGRKYDRAGMYSLRIYFKILIFDFLKLFFKRIEIFLWQ